ncbi:acetyl-CoA synthetase-like protein [Hymenopellis radicata]|nr:acetyl-CoA synthetase-like protein [Hymenopellis radicata]
MPLHTEKPGYFGKGSVEVAPPARDGEGGVRRLAITADKLVTQPFEGLDVIPDVLDYAARTYGSRNAEKDVKKMVDGKEVTEKKKWKYFQLSGYQWLSYIEFKERVSQIGRGLIDLGVASGDIFNVYSQTSANWQLMANACGLIGTTIATAYDTLGEEKTPTIKYIIYDGDKSPSSPTTSTRSRLHPQGQSLSRLLNGRRPKPDTVACIMYTSGSTGPPKGVVLSHSNLVASIGAVYVLLGHHLTKTTPTWRDIAELRPSIMVGVPAVWEMIPVRKSVFNGSMTLKRNKVPVLAQVADSVVLSNVRAATGGRLRVGLAGGAAISRETQEFLMSRYGMTESCGMCAVLPPEVFRYGAVGLPMPSIEIKLLDVPDAGYTSKSNPPQGEGYYKRPDLNEDPTIFTEDGWMRTGDVGQWNSDGTLTLVDRIKNLIKLAGGEYIALERLESIYKSCNLINNMCVYATADATQPMAIIIPHEAHMRHYLESVSGVDAKAGLASLCHTKKVQELVLKECNAIGKKNGFKTMELLQAVVLTPDEWTPESGLVTAAQKIQRNAIAKKFDTEIKEVYKH